MRERTGDGATGGRGAAARTAAAGAGVPGAAPATVRMSVGMFSFGAGGGWADQ